MPIGNAVDRKGARTEGRGELQAMYANDVGGDLALSLPACHFEVQSTIHFAAGLHNNMLFIQSCATIMTVS